ncbi:hypothetical protein F4604DRAFT_1938346 [Suillus subluteus]|nr:hypothetical protein F4604DRAFT_1938346 [Suillus subluteus]
MDFVGAASTNEGFIPSGGLWTFDESNTESFIDETEVLLPAHPATSSLDPHTPLLYNKYQSLSYNPPPSSSQTGTEVLLSAHPAAFDPYTPSLYNDTLSLSYSPPPSSSQTGTPISSWTREVWDQQVSSPLCSSTPHFQMGPSYIFPNSHLPRSGSEPAIPAAPAPIDDANAISAPSMCLPAQTHAATTTISKQAAAPAVTMDKHLPSLVDASRKTGRIRQATTHLTQANNIGDNRESKNETQGSNHRGSLSSSKRQKL